jgi:O-antigen ligase
MVVALLFSMILGGSEIPIFGRKPVVAPFDILFLAVLFLFLYRGVVGGFSLNFRDRPVFYLALVFMFIQVISFLFNLRDVPRGFLGVKVFVFGYLSYVFCLSAVKRTKDVERILCGLVLWGATLSALLIYYYITDWSSIIGQQAGNETKSEIGIAIGRSNYLAALLVPILPLAIASTFAHCRSLRIRAGICAGLIFAGLLITMSKGALLSLVAGSVCASPMLWRAGVRLWHAIVILGAAVSFLLLSLLIFPDLLSVTYDMFSSSLGTPDFARLDLWKVGWQVFAMHPLFGVGPNAVYLYNRQFAIDDLYTHNFILNTLSELGLTGGLAFFLLLGVLLRRSYRLCLSTLADPKLKPIALGLFVGFLSTLAHGLVEPTFPGQQYAVIFWMCMALVYLHQRQIEQSALANIIVPVPLGYPLTPGYGLRRYANGEMN